MDKIAAASTDGVTINAHYGQAKKFYIFLVDEHGNITNGGVREAALPAGIPEDEILSAKADLLGDVDYVLSAKIGPAALRSLALREIRAYAHTGTIENVLRNFAKRRDLIGKLAGPESEYLASCISRGGGEGGCGGCSGRGR
jgi:nitrogen fixation protein NifB